MKGPDSFERKELLKPNIRTNFSNIIHKRCNDFIYVLIEAYYDFLAQQIGKA